MQPSERARVAGVGEGGGAAESAGLVLEDLEVVIELDGLPVAFDDPLMPGHDLPAVEYDELRRAQRDAEFAADEPDRDGVLRLPHRHQPGPVDPRVELQARVEPIPRQLREMLPIGGEVLGDSADLLPDPPSLIPQIPFTDPGVELGEGRDDGHG